MGLLDRMVADLIADSTGLPVRRLIRRVGVGRLLLLGGAAAAGGYAVQSLSQRRGTGTAPAPPPPPPSPAVASQPAVQLPPLPPPPQPASVAMPTELELALARAMVAAALADDRLDEAERRILADHLEAGELPPEHAAQIHRDLLAPASPETLASMVVEPNHRLAMVRAAVLVIAADHDVSAAERAWLERLTTALGLATGQVAELEAELTRLAEATD